MNKVRTRLTRIAGLLSVAAFAVGVAMAQSGGGEEEESQLSCNHLSLCSGSIACDHGATVSCCRTKTAGGAWGNWSCICCYEPGDCTTQGTTKQCNDQLAGN